MQKVNILGTEYEIIRESFEEETIDGFCDYTAHAIKIRNNNVSGVGDFEKLIDRAEKEDLLFLDPPYTVRHNNNGFVKYNEVLFSWADQERLANAANRARLRGAKIIITNANHESLRELYLNNFTVKEVSRYSSIAAKSLNRNKYEELIITCNI